MLINPTRSDALEVSSSLFFLRDQFHMFRACLTDNLISSTITCFFGNPRN
jgi:hypothetical protein